MSDPGACFSVYHSCTKPFWIVGDVNGGAVSRSQYDCKSKNSADWPEVWVSDNGEEVQAGTPGLYRCESSVWSDVNFTLTTVPGWYAEDAGGLCGEKLNPTTTIRPEITVDVETIEEPTSVKFREIVQ